MVDSSVVGPPQNRILCGHTAQVLTLPVFLAFHLSGSFRQTLSFLDSKNRRRVNRTPNISLMNYDKSVIISGDIRLEIEDIRTGDSKSSIKGVVRTSRS
jgi:hypothetical protein